MYGPGLEEFLRLASGKTAGGLIRCFSALYRKKRGDDKVVRTTRYRGWF
jgi:hypothetical protein